METVLIVIHLMIVVALIATVLLQRSEGGALGIGGGNSGGGGFMTGRGAANALTRTTAILAVAFFATSIGLTLLARNSSSILDLGGTETQTENGTAPASGGDQGFEQFQQQLGIGNGAGDGTTAPSPDQEPQVPQSQ